METNSSFLLPSKKSVLLYIFLFYRIYVSEINNKFYLFNYSFSMLTTVNETEWEINKWVFLEEILGLFVVFRKYNLALGIVKRLLKMFWCEKYRKSTKEIYLHLLSLGIWRNNFLWTFDGIALVPFASCWMTYISGVRDCEIVFLTDLTFKHWFFLISFPPKNSIFQKCNCCLEIFSTGLEKLSS